MQKTGKWNKLHMQVHKTLTNKNACYILITCGRPSDEGKMEVEMTYEGEPSLAAYLIESAHHLLEHNDDLSA
jgi:hypothetical protein